MQIFNWVFQWRENWACACIVNLNEIISNLIEIIPYLKLACEMIDDGHISSVIIKVYRMNFINKRKPAGYHPAADMTSVDIKWKVS